MVFWSPFSLKTHLEVSSHARARQVREQSSLQVNSFILEGHESSAIDPGLRLGTKNNQRQAFEGVLELDILELFRPFLTDIRSRFPAPNDCP